MNNDVLHENLNLQAELHPDRDYLEVTTEEYDRLLRELVERYNPPPNCMGTYWEEIKRGFTDFRYQCRDGFIRSLKVVKDNAGNDIRDKQGAVD